MTNKEIKQNIGKILVKSNREYTWMFKLIDINPDYNDLIVTYGMDIKPQPKAYHCQICDNPFNKTFEEINVDVRIPTKKELNLYRKYTIELRILGTNKSEYGTK